VFDFFFFIFFVSSLEEHNFSSKDYVH